MVVYVIIFSIVMVLLLALTVAVGLIYCTHLRKKLTAATSVITQKQQGEQSFSDVFGNSKAIAYILLDAHTQQPVYVSPSIVEFLGVSAEEVYFDTDSAKKNIDKKYVREFKHNFAAWDQNGILEQKFVYGEDRYAKLTALVSEKDGGRFIAFTIHDVTEQEKHNQSMQDQLDDALAQAAAKSSFLASMSHEIRTPMNGVTGMLSLARMNIDDKDKALGYLERAGDLTSFLLSLINDVLDISKIESGKMQLFNTETDLFAFAEKIRSMFNSTVTAKGVDFVVETIDFTSRRVMVDEMRLTQVVTNLVSNANKFTPAGGKITVTFKQMGFMDGNMQIMIRVRDTGKGIAPENIGKIMRPFEQEEASTSHKYGGTGLGLAICDNIVRLMGGNIVIDSVLGKGTDFSVYLSLEAVESAQTNVSADGDEDPIEAAEFTYQDCRILLAEDNEVNAEIAIEMLEVEGAKVTHAHDGQEAVDLFINNPERSFDLILLDIHMPRLDGHGAARAIRASDKNDAQSVPIIALSADAFVEDIKLSEEAGMDGHVSKPIDYAELKRRAGEIIAAKRRAAKSKRNKK